MTEREYVLAVVDAAQRVGGRTILQKVVYLVAAKRRDNLGFSAHFYGPYSRELYAEVERLVAAGLLEERVTSFEPWQPQPFDGRQYTYRLTPEGTAAAAKVPKDLSAAAIDVVQTAKKSLAWSAPALSIAAKLHYLHEIEPNLPMTDMPNMAQEFGWQIDSKSAEVGAKLISKLGLV